MGMSLPMKMFMCMPELGDVKLVIVGSGMWREIGVLQREDFDNAIITVEEA
jgi:hypothetical protein